MRHIPVHIDIIFIILTSHQQTYFPITLISTVVNCDIIPLLLAFVVLAASHTYLYRSKLIFGELANRHQTARATGVCVF